METSRLVLRRFNPEDWKDLYEYLSDPNVVKFEPYESYSESEAMETTEAVIEKGFSSFGARRVVAICNPLNTPSWNLPERLAMRREGHLVKNIYFKYDSNGNPIWSDTNEYGVLKEE